MPNRKIRKIGIRKIGKLPMLAERRRKNKWCYNPNGLKNGGQTEKFGKTMLEKLGWSEGQGLGKFNQGRVDPVKVKVKNDAKGVGFQERAEAGLTHQDDFESMLGDLAASHSAGNDQDSDQIRPSFCIQAESSITLPSKDTEENEIDKQKFSLGGDLNAYFAQKMEQKKAAAASTDLYTDIASQKRKNKILKKSKKDKKEGKVGIEKTNVEHENIEKHKKDIFKKAKKSKKEGKVGTEKTHVVEHENIEKYKKDILKKAKKSKKDKKEGKIGIDKTNIAEHENIKKHKRDKENKDMVSNVIASDNDNVTETKKRSKKKKKEKKSKQEREESDILGFKGTNILSIKGYGKKD